MNNTAYKLVLIETSSNQKYIYQTNKLRENIGASALLHQATTYGFLDKAALVFNLKLPEFSSPPTSEEISRYLNNDDPEPKSPRFEQNGVEFIIISSGKTMFMVEENNLNLAKSLVSEVTYHALKFAPGLDIRAVISPQSYQFGQNQLEQAIQDIYRLFKHNMGKLPAPEMRFPTLPVSQPCATTGLPAEKILYDKKDAETGVPLSAQAISKSDECKKGKTRIKNLIGRDIPEDIESLKKNFDEMKWLALIHADGNGLGQIFMKFRDNLDQANIATDDRNYIDHLRKFSLAIDHCTIQSFKNALPEINQNPNGSNTEKADEANNLEKNIIPVIPLILGGDDLTVICDSHYALKFTVSFLKHFEEKTRQDDIISQLTKGKGLTCCAGIAYIKPHYPFYSGYNLAEQLLNSAKRTKQYEAPCSAFDFHIHYDASGGDLDIIRNHYNLKDGSYLSTRPFIVDDIATDGQVPFSPIRQWSNIMQAMQYVPRITDNRQGNDIIPNSMLHYLREALFQGKAFADTTFSLALGRYNASHWNQILSDQCDEGSLFFKDKAPWDEEEISKTRLLDLIDLSEIWGDM